jgi:two-component system, cell cycle sensor histidine kinase and response regulator CckA
VDVTDWQRAEEAHRQSERRTRLIIDTALDAVITMDAAGSISGWNTQAEKIFGWSRQEVLGRRMSETIIPIRFREAHNRGLAKFLETGEGPVLDKRIEISALRRDGVEIPVELAISPGKLGSEWTFSAFIRDLTEQKKVAEALRREEQRYRDLFEHSPVGLYRSTPDGRLIDANPAMVSMLGYPDRESLLATPAATLYTDPADRLRWTAEMTRADIVRDFKVRLRRGDGAEIWALDTTYAKREADGRVVLYEGVMEDITDRVEAERRLQASERRLIQILEAVPLGILVSDMDGNVVFANAGAQNILGSGVVPGLTVTELAKTHRSYLAGTDQLYPDERMPLRRAMSGEATAVDDIEIRHGERVISLNARGAPILDGEGQVVAAVVVFIDTTDRRALEGQLRQTSKMEAVGQLAGGVAHDFNNLLTVIMSYGAMLLEQMDPADPNREDIQEIAAAADRAAALTGQLLAFSRKQVMQPRVMDINAVVSEVESMLRRLIGEDIELRISLDPDVARINADPGQLQQVLMNLVVNARDAMPTGGRLIITTSNSELSSEFAAGALHAADGDYVMLAVSDTGIGMTSEVKRRVFDPFFTTKEQGRGTGLGLSTVYGIVKQSGGEICVYSEVGEGATFKVYFPRFSRSTEEQLHEVIPRDLPRGSETLLLVEDDSGLRRLTMRVLKNCGYEVLVAAGGAEALAIAADSRIHIHAVISDVVMPGMNGRKLVEKLIESRPGMASLLMSGYTDDEVLRRGVLQGDTAFLQKPFNPDQLARKMREVLDRAAEQSLARR